MKSEINEIINIQNTDKEMIDQAEKIIIKQLTECKHQKGDSLIQNMKMMNWEKIYLKCKHIMKYNLIYFGGISYKDSETENTEIVLKHFLQTELEITCVGDI